MKPQAGFSWSLLQAAPEDPQDNVPKERRKGYKLPKRV
jgi:hypothetical protein